jgi:hypothetical protein
VIESAGCSSMIDQASHRSLWPSRSTIALPEGRSPPNYDGRGPLPRLALQPGNRSSASTASTAAIVSPSKPVQGTSLNATHSRGPQR